MYMKLNAQWCIHLIVYKIEDVIGPRFNSPFLQAKDMNPSICFVLIVKVFSNTIHTIKPELLCNNTRNIPSQVA